MNKIGKEGKTRDSFHAIMMGHNVWMHINAVQEANRQYDNGVPMLVQERLTGYFLEMLWRQYLQDPTKTKHMWQLTNLVNFDEHHWTRGATERN